MVRVIFVLTLTEVILNVQCEPESTAKDQNIDDGTAEKIGFLPTVLKVFIKGDIPAEEIQKLLNLYTRQDKLPIDSDLMRSRRNSITDYIGKLYSYNNLFRPYRSIFKGFKTTRTTKIPWLKRFLGVRGEASTESFWGMALGAHTFSPLVRSLSHTRMPYHRIRDRQRIDKLLGMTRKYANWASHDQTKPYQWLKTQEQFDEIIGQAKSEGTTTAMDYLSMNGTKRKAFHAAPLDVAGLKSSLFSHLHPSTTPKRPRFCDKQCGNEVEGASTEHPGNTEQHRHWWDHVKSTDALTTKVCTCTTNPCDEDNEIEDTESVGDCEVECLSDTESHSAMTKNVKRTKHTTIKMTTSKFTKSKEQRLTGPVWSLPLNSVLDVTEMVDVMSTEPQGGRGLTGTKKLSTTALEINSKNTCNQEKPNNQHSCNPLPIPTRTWCPACPDRPKSTRGCTRKTTIADEKCSTRLDSCDCQTRKPPLQNIPMSIGVPLDEHNQPGECNPQKIVVRISAALGEVPVVIMRDNRVPGVSLSLVNDYVLDESNRLIKCLGQKPFKGSLNLNNSVKLAQHSRVLKTKSVLPHLIKHQLHSLQPKLFRIRHKPNQRLASDLRAAQTQNLPKSSNPAMNQGLNLFPSYNFNSLGSFGLQYPAIQSPGSYGAIQDSAESSRMNSVPIPQVDFSGEDISSKQYSRVLDRPGVDRMSLSPFGQARLNIQPFPPQILDTSQFTGYQPPFLPIFYPNQNGQSQKW